MYCKLKNKLYKHKNFIKNFIKQKLYNFIKIFPYSNYKKMFRQSSMLYIIYVNLNIKPCETYCYRAYSHGTITNVRQNRVVLLEPVVNAKVIIWKLAASRNRLLFGQNKCIAQKLKYIYVWYSLLFLYLLVLPMEYHILWQDDNTHVLWLFPPEWLKFNYLVSYYLYF